MVVFIAVFMSVKVLWGFLLYHEFHLTSFWFSSIRVLPYEMKMQASLIMCRHVIPRHH